MTAYADILAGCAAAAPTDLIRPVALLAATTGLYGGGVVLNDFFDAGLDAIERPERPIPSGQISRRQAQTLGISLLSAGVLAGFLCSILSGLLAMLIAAAVLLYDSVGKKHNLLGPLNMGLCRGLNLLLGLSVAGTLPAAKTPLALVSLCYIAGVTALSRGEVRGGTRQAALIAAAWLGGSVLFFVLLASQSGAGILACIPFVALLLFRTGKPFWDGFRTLEPLKIRAAIRAAILSIIVLDACLAALFGGPAYGLAILLLYLPAAVLARKFAVT